MADNKKYYYLKLKEDFFNSDELLLIQAMPDGYIYSDILMKLYLRSLRTEGRLMYKNRIPYSPEVLATLVHHKVGMVEKALRVFMDYGLIEILDNGAIYMMDIQNFIGKSSTEADRQREYQHRIAEEKELLLSAECEKSNKKSNKISTPEIEIEIELETDLDTEIESETELQRDIEVVPAPSKKAQEPAEEPFITLMLNDRSEYPFYEKDVIEYQELYPAVDVRQQFRTMKGWCKDNPTKRKTKRGIRKFVNSWLAREQDKFHPSVGKSYNNDRIANRVSEVDSWNV